MAKKPKLKFYLKKRGLLWVAIFGCIAGAGFFSHRIYTASLSDNVVVMQTVTSEEICDRDGICEKDKGENILNCGEDCRSSSFPKSGEPAPIDMVPSLWGLEVYDVTSSSARVKWNTDIKSACELRWGRNSDYENSSIAELQSDTTHSVLLESLLESATYHFKIFCKAGDIEVATDDQVFSTIKGQDETPPGNVAGLSAWYIYEENKVVLRWKNPETDFSGVTVLRNDRYFPRDQWDGVPLCDGNIQNCDDLEVEKNKKYYYTVFAYDKSKNYSSGAVTSITIGELLADPVTEKNATSTEIVSSLSLIDFIFTQNGRQLEYRDGYYIAKANEKVTVYVDEMKFAKVAKEAVISTRIDMVEQIYLFKLDRRKGGYVSDLYFENSDIYPFTIFWTDFLGNRIRLSGNLLIEGSYKDITDEFAKNIFDEVVPDLILLIVLSLMIAAVIERGLRKRKKSRDRAL